MSGQADLGLTHLALVCTNAEATIDFYRRYAGLDVIHDRTDDGVRVFWLSDRKRPFAIVFLEADKAEAPLGPFAHVGVAVESRAAVDRLAEQARGEGVLAVPPEDHGPPVGYLAMIRDPDGHTLEVSYGQHVEHAVDAGA